MNKYGAQKVAIDGYTFASKAEARRYDELRWLAIGKQIRDLSVHPSWPLTINGVTIGRFTGDFSYFEAGKLVCEDVKGVISEAASLRMRVFLALYPEIQLRIIQRRQQKVFRQRKVAA